MKHAVWDPVGLLQFLGHKGTHIPNDDGRVQNNVPPVAVELVAQGDQESSVLFSKYKKYTQYEKYVQYA